MLRNNLIVLLLAAAGPFFFLREREPLFAYREFADSL